jgi:hypothetical protein
MQMPRSDCRPKCPRGDPTAQKCKALKNRRAPEQLPATIRSVHNNIWVAPFGDVGAGTTAEVASKRTLSGYCCAIPYRAMAVLYETTWPIAHSEGLRKAGRRNPTPHRRAEPLHCSRHTCHSASRINPPGERGSTPLIGFVQQSR